jgi:hypothetical protein
MRQDTLHNQHADGPIPSSALHSPCERATVCTSAATEGHALRQRSRCAFELIQPSDRMLGAATRSKLPGRAQDSHKQPGGGRAVVQAGIRGAPGADAPEIPSFWICSAAEAERKQPNLRRSFAPAPANMFMSSSCDS